MPDAEPPVDNLPQIVPPEEASIIRAPEGERDMAVLEKDFFERSLSSHTVHAAKLRNDLVQAYINNLDADREMRKTYAGRILKYLEFYSAGVGLLLLGEGFGTFIGFSLEKEVVTTLVGSTAVAAIGLVGFIARGLFRSPAELPAPGEKDGNGAKEG